MTPTGTNKGASTTTKKRGRPHKKIFQDSGSASKILMNNKQQQLQRDAMKQWMTNCIKSENSPQKNINDTIRNRKGSKSPTKRTVTVYRNNDENSVNNNNNNCPLSRTPTFDEILNTTRNKKSPYRTQLNEIGGTALVFVQKEKQTTKIPPPNTSFRISTTTSSNHPDNSSHVSTPLADLKHEAIILNNVTVAITTPAKDVPIVQPPPIIVDDRCCSRYDVNPGFFGKDQGVTWYGGTVLAITPSTQGNGKGVSEWKIQIQYDDHQKSTIVWPKDAPVFGKLKRRGMHSMFDNIDVYDRIVYDQMGNEIGREFFCDCRPTEIHAGDRVVAYYQNGLNHSAWHTGRIATVRTLRDNNIYCDIAYDDGEYEMYIPLFSSQDDSIIDRKDSLCTRTSFSSAGTRSRYNIVGLEHGMDKTTWLVGLEVELPCDKWKSIKSGLITRITPIDRQVEIEYRLGNALSYERKPYELVIETLFDNALHKLREEDAKCTDINNKKIKIWPGSESIAQSMTDDAIGMIGKRRSPRGTGVVSHSGPGGFNGNGGATTVPTSSSTSQQQQSSRTSVISKTKKKKVVVDGTKAKPSGDSKKRDTTKSSSSSLIDESATNVLTPNEQHAVSPTTNIKSSTKVVSPTKNVTSKKSTLTTSNVTSKKSVSTTNNTTPTNNTTSKKSRALTSPKKRASTVQAPGPSVAPNKKSRRTLVVDTMQATTSVSNPSIPDTVQQSSPSRDRKQPDRYAPPSQAAATKRPQQINTTSDQQHQLGMTTIVALDNGDDTDYSGPDVVIFNKRPFRRMNKALGCVLTQAVNSSETQVGVQMLTMLNTCHNMIPNYDVNGRLLDLIMYGPKHEKTLYPDCYKLDEALRQVQFQIIATKDGTYEFTQILGLDITNKFITQMESCYYLAGGDEHRTTSQALKRVGQTVHAKVCFATIYSSLLQCVVKPLCYNGSTTYRISEHDDNKPTTNNLSSWKENKLVRSILQFPSRGSQGVLDKLVTITATFWFKFHHHLLPNYNDDEGIVNDVAPDDAHTSRAANSFVVAQSIRFTELMGIIISYVARLYANEANENVEALADLIKNTILRVWDDLEDKALAEGNSIHIKIHHASKNKGKSYSIKNGNILSKSRREQLQFKFLLQLDKKICPGLQRKLAERFLLVKWYDDLGMYDQC